MKNFKDNTDGDLLRDYAVHGSDKAFAELVCRHGQMVHAVALRVLSNRHDAEDVTQAVFVVMAREAGSLSRQPSVGGWLHKVARNTSLNAYKSRQNRTRREHAAMNELSDANPDPQTVSALRSELDAAIVKLPERYRQPIILFHLEGASLDEVSARLGLNPNTLGTRLARGREILRQALVRKGVQISGVAALAGVLATEAKAATLTPSLHAALLATASKGASATPSVLYLADQASRSLPISLTTLTNLLIIMKTKTAVTATIAIGILGIVTIAIMAKSGSPNNSQDSNTQAINTASDRMPEVNGKRNIREKKDPLSVIASEGELGVILDSIAHIADETDRLEAIRERLGLDISDEAYRKALEIYGSQIDGEELFEALLMAVLEADPALAMAWTQRLPEPLKSQFSYRILAEWMRSDEAAALSYAQKNLDPKIIADAEERLQDRKDSTLSREQIDERLRELKAAGKNPSSDWSEYFRVLHDLGKIDPKASLDQAIALRKEFGEDFHLKNNIDSALTDWSVKDPDAAYAWAMKIEDETERLDALLIALPAWMLKNPNAKLDLDMDTLSDEQNNRFAFTLLEHLSKTNPAAAADYALGQPDASIKQSMVSQVTRNWVMSDQQAAIGWVQGIKDAALRDQNLSAISRYIGASDLAAARNLIETIQDEQTKSSVISNLLSSNDSWDNNTPEALRIIAELPQVKDSEVLDWADHIKRHGNPESIKDFQKWVNQAHAKGNIKYMEMTDSPGESTPEEKKQQAAKKGLSEILEKLK